MVGFETIPEQVGSKAADLDVQLSTSRKLTGERLELLVNLDVPLIRAGITRVIL